VAQIAGAGWQNVLATLVAERGDALTRYAYVLCGDPDDAADLVQAALVATFGRLRNGFASRPSRGLRAHGDRERLHSTVVAGRRAGGRQRTCMSRQTRSRRPMPAPNAASISRSNSQG